MECFRSVLKGFGEFLKGLVGFWSVLEGFGGFLEDLGGFKELYKTLQTELLTSTERCTPRVEHAAGPQGPGADLSAYGNLPHRALGCL